MNQLDEKQLIAQAQKGDISAFEKLIEKYYQKIYNFALTIITDKSLAEDLTQEALIKAYKKIKKFKGVSSFTTWLYRIIYNTFQDELKKSYRKYELNLPNEISIKLTSNHSKLEDLIEEKETQIMIRRAIKSLGEDYANLILLRELQGLSYEELANVFNIPIGTVKSRLFKARELLKERLKKILEIK